jgi:hypothetical protein
MEAPMTPPVAGMKAKYFKSRSSVSPDIRISMSSSGDLDQDIPTPKAKLPDRRSHEEIVETAYDKPMHLVKRKMDAVKRKADRGEEVTVTTGYHRYCDECYKVLFHRFDQWYKCPDCLDPFGRQGIDFCKGCVAKKKNLKHKYDAEDHKHRWILYDSTKLRPTQFIEEERIYLRP